MDSKSQEIVRQQNKQRQLKDDIEAIKKKQPTYIIGFILFTFLSFYFLEDKFYNFFGNSVDFFITGIIILGLFCLFFIYRNHLTINKKDKEIKVISSKLYKLMKLDTKDTNE
ncbi:hypothetical protein H9W90_01415 [Polaribacter pectinis]|uniref:Uncharacterized protein n=1 Tax=Polaribacter pectinis TaxID=2738844 RepID=A0A7G9LB07_9FLAO|nr:hypothetical protein [Polaribacter pectinis]QNM85806.1 hypothetical protein H9W90_01415 [Polaribacter pectinis]